MLKKSDLTQLSPIDCKIILYGMLNDNQIVINISQLSNVLGMARRSIRKSLLYLEQLNIIECSDKEFKIFDVISLTKSETSSITVHKFGGNECYTSETSSLNSDTCAQSEKIENRTLSNDSKVGTEIANHYDYDLYKNHKEKSKKETKLYKLFDFFTGLYDLPELLESLDFRDPSFNIPIEKLNCKNPKNKALIKRLEPFWNAKIQSEFLIAADLAIRGKAVPSAYMITCIKNKLVELENKQMEKLDAQTKRALTVLEETKIESERQTQEIRGTVEAYKISNPVTYKIIKSKCDTALMEILDTMSGSDDQKRASLRYKKLISKKIYDEIKKIVEKG